MPARTKILISAATVIALLRIAVPAVAATWAGEPVPAGPGALGPARLSFDAHGRGLLLWNGVPTASQPRFTGMASRAPGGGWTRIENLPGVGWGNAQALQYATTRVLFVSGQVASVGAYNRAKLRLVAAFGRSDGSVGRWQQLASSETGFVASVTPAGHAIVLFDAGGDGLSTIERPSGGQFGRARKVSPPGAFTPAAAINERGDRIVAWIRSGRIEARVRKAGHDWGSVHDVAKAPGVANTSLRAAATRGGSFVLAWDVAEVREGRPPRLIAGAALRKSGQGWRVHSLENETLGTAANLATEENAIAVPLVTEDGAIGIAWTGAVDDGARVGVKAARLTTQRLHSAQVVSDPATNAALGEAAVGPRDQVALVYSRLDDQTRVSTYAALSPGPGFSFGPSDLVTPAGSTGISGPTVGFQTVTGQAIAIVPIIQGTSGGFASAVQAP